jgi:hypothetical protein
MKDIYILFGMDEEPGKRWTGEFGHDIIWSIVQVPVVVIGNHTFYKLDQ